MNGQMDEVQELYQAAKEDPDAVDVEEVLPHLEAEGSTERTIALRAIGAVAAQEPERILEHLEDLRPVLEDDVAAPKTVGVFLFAFAAEEYPDEVVPYVDELVNLLDQEPPLLRFRAAGALSRLLVDHREEFVPHFDDLVDVFYDAPDVMIPDPDDPEVPEEMREQVASVMEERGQQIQEDKARADGVLEFAANAIVEIAEVEPETVASRIDDVAEFMDADRAIVRTALVDTVATVAEHDPDAVEPVVDPVRERLDDENDYVRAHAVRALGYAEAGEAVDELRELADSDVEEDLAELATDTADWLEENA